MSDVRLIDANAFCAFLREVSTRQHYEKLLCKEDKFPTVADVIEAICCDLDGTSINGFDNAPTVNPFFPSSREEFYKITDAEWELSDSFWITTPSGKKIEFEKKRPQGEWIMDKEHTKNPLLWYKCNLCGVYHSPTNFCPHCGADNRGTTE